MKFEYINDIKGFLKMIDRCSGNVYLVTTDGDKLNLKSKLTQYIAFADIFADNTITDMELAFDQPGDENTVVEYLLNGGGIRELEK